MLKLLIQLAWRNLWRNPRRTLITLVVVAAGLFSVLTLNSLIEAWAQSSRDQVLDLTTGAGQIHAPGYLDDPTVAHRMAPPDAALAKVLNTSPVTAWSARLRVSAVVQSEYRTLPVTLIATDPARERKLSTIPLMIAAGRYLTGPDDPGIVLGRHLAERLKTEIGRRVILMAQAADGTLAQRSFTVEGLFAGSQSAEDNFAFTGLNPAQTMLGAGDQITEISFAIADQQQLGAAIAAMKSAAPGLDVRSWRQLSPMAAAMDTMMSGFVYIWLWVMFALMAIGIVNTQLMAVHDRVREFGLLEALGMRPRLVLMQVAIESALLVGIGVIAGGIAAALTIAALSGGIDLGFLARGAEYFGAGHVLYPHLAPREAVGIAALIWALGVAVSLWPAYRAAKSNPVEAMSHAT